MCPKPQLESTLDLNQDQEQSPTSDLNQHPQEETISDDTIDLSVAAVSFDYSGTMSFQD